MCSALSAFRVPPFTQGMAQVSLKAINALNEGKICRGIRKHGSWGRGRQRAIPQHGRWRAAHPLLQPGTGSSRGWAALTLAEAGGSATFPVPPPAPRPCLPAQQSTECVSCSAALYWKHRAGPSLGWVTAACLALLGEFVWCLQPRLDHNAEHPRSWMQHCCAHRAQPCTAGVSWGTYHAEPSLSAKGGIIFSVLVRLRELIPICNQKFLDSVRLNISGKETWKPLRVY